MSQANPEYLLWIDLETTGFTNTVDKILELAYIVTEFKYPYKPVARAAFMVNQHRDDVYALMDDVCLAMHTKSGLLKDRESHPGSPIEDIEAHLLAISENWSIEKELKTPVAGFSCAFDRGFIRQNMPIFTKRISHRIFDVSAMSLMCRSLGMPRLKKEELHRAAADVEDSVEHMRRCARWLRSLDALVHEKE